MLDTILNLPTTVRVAILAAAAALLMALGVWAATASTTAPPVEGEDPVGGEVIIAPTTPPTTSGTGPDRSEPADPDGGVLDLTPPVSPAEQREAGQVAIEFVEAMQSYRYDQDPQAIQVKLNRLMARESTISLDALTVTGPQLADARRTKLTVAVDVTQATLTLLTDRSMSFELATREVTRTQGQPARTASADYGITVTKTNSSWRVAEFYTSESPFQD